MKNKLYAKIDADGRLKFDDPASFAKTCAQYRSSEVEVNISKRRKPRTLPENNYYWGVVVELIAEWSGYSLEEAHDALKVKFLCEDYHKGLRKIKSTSVLSTVEFEQYLTAVRKWASEQGLFIPLPNEEIY